MEIEKLYPEFKDNIWGGEQLKTRFNKVTDKSPVAESWELSFHKDGKCRLKNGKTLEESVTEKDLGENCKSFPFFPILIKFIDAKENLSVQVHPSDEYALKNENSFGKTEMWYIVDSSNGAGIYLGFKKDVTKAEFEKAISDNTLIDLLNFYPVKKGEHYFIPSGTIHAIGAGCLICEIQQNSNLTYRVYDYGRKDKFGNGRELHIQKAITVSDLNKFVNNPENADFNGGKMIGKSKYFTVCRYLIDGDKELCTDEKSFLSITAVDGTGFINGESIKAGDTFFVPANYGKFIIFGKGLTIITACV